MTELWFEVTKWRRVSSPGKITAEGANRLNAQAMVSCQTRLVFPTDFYYGSQSLAGITCYVYISTDPVDDTKHMTLSYWKGGIGEPSSMSAQVVMDKPSYECLANAILAGNKTIQTFVRLDIDAVPTKYEGISHYATWPADQERVIIERVLLILGHYQVKLGLSRTKT